MKGLIEAINLNGFQFASYHRTLFSQLVEEELVLLLSTMTSQPTHGIIFLTSTLADHLLAAVSSQIKFMFFAG